MASCNEVTASINEVIGHFNEVTARNDEDIRHYVYEINLSINTLIASCNTMRPHPLDDCQRRMQPPHVLGFESVCGVSVGDKIVIYNRCNIRRG